MPKNIITPDELLKADKVVLHDSLIGPVSFVVGGESLKKGYVQAHYRHTKNGDLVFVEGYHNKVQKKPEDLAPIAHKKYQDELAQYHQFKQENPGKKKKAPAEHDDKYLSFHFGDEVFVKYSHMHDQHFGVGAVVGIRDDASHDGKLVEVKLLDGRKEFYDPASLVHIHKNNYEELGRKYEQSLHKDDKGNPIPYEHLDQEQRVKFYDLYKLWYRLHRMGEQLAFKENLAYFKKPDGSLPTHKSDLSAEQKLFLESKNPYAVVPYEALLASVGQEEYSDSQHHAFVKKLLEDIKTLEKKGAPPIQFPKLYKPKSKKSNPYVPEAWLQGQFPSVGTEDKPDKDDYAKLQSDIAAVTGMGTETPNTEGGYYTSGADAYYGGGGGGKVVHGSVKVPKPEGSKYQPAPKVPSIEEDQKVKIADTAESYKQAEEAVKQGAPKPIVPAEKEEPKLVVHGEAEDISNLKFKVTANAKKLNFGGAHSKYILEDEKGQKYLYKPYGEGLHRVWADIIPAQLAKAIGLPTVEMGMSPVKLKIPVGMGGSYAGVEAVGSVQKIVEPLKHNSIEHWVEKGFKGAPQSIIEQLQREHVLDWLVGNNDAHQEQFIVGHDGKLIGVDKGQAFKFYKQDVLALDYDPNFNKDAGHEQVYNLMLLAAKKGDVKLDWSVVHEFIENNISNLSQLAWTKMVTPYAQHSVKWVNDVGKFQSLASKRKANLLYDFKKLYQSIGIATEYNKEKKAYEKSAPVVKEKLPESLTYQPDAFHQIDSFFHEKVMAAKAHGFSRMIGGGDIEDMNVLFTPYNWDKADVKAGKTGKGMEVRAKVLAGSEEKILSWFDTVDDQAIEYMNMNGALQSNHDPLGGVVVAAAKTVNHHAPNVGKSPDGEYNASKMNMFAQWFQHNDTDNKAEFDPNKGIISVEQLAAKLMQKHITSTHYDDYLTLSHKIASYYHAMAQEVLDAAAAKKQTVSKSYKPWAGPYKIKQTAVSNKKHPYATWPTYELDEEGNLTRKLGDKEAMHNTAPGNFGVMFTKDLPGNIQVRYYPHYSTDLEGQNNFRSQQGSLILDFHNWDGNVDAMHQAREVIKGMGLDHRLATSTDVECLYLTRIIWQNKGNVNHKKEYDKILQMENSEKKVEALKELCKKTYDGVEPTSLPTYKPAPLWDVESGSHYFMNPYVLHHLHYNKPAKVKIATHGLKAGTTDEKLKYLAQHGLLATEMRHKFNMPYYGMSSLADQSSGGAAYVFTSASQKPLDDLMNGVPTGHLVFRPELYARTDAFGYKSDYFGSTATDYENGHGSIDNRVPIMEIVTTPTSLYEVMYKNRVALDKWFVGIKGDGSDDYSTSAKTVKGWVSKFKKYLMKYRPHILNHAEFIGVKD